MADSNAGGVASTDGTAPASDNSSLSPGQSLPNDQSSGGDIAPSLPAVESGAGDDVQGDQEADAQASPADTLLSEAIAFLSAGNQSQPQFQNFDQFRGGAPAQQESQPTEFKYQPIIDDKFAQTIKQDYPELEGVFGALEKRLESAERRDHERNQSIVKDRAKLDQFDAFYSEQRATQARKALDPVIDSFGNEALYGNSDKLTPAAGKMRAELVGQARILQEQAQARGLNMHDSHALAMANAILTGSKNLTMSKPAAVKAVEQQVIDRSKQRRIAPGGRATNTTQNNAPVVGTAIDEWTSRGRPK